MLDGIDFLENLGQDARLRYASQDEVEFALSKAVVEPAMQVAILAKNGPGLQALLGQEPFCCLINPAKPSDEQGECDGSCREGMEKDGTTRSKQGEEGNPPIS